MNQNKDKVQEIIEKSGNDLQFKVADYLSSHKWEVSISPYYNDPATGKQREIDLIATRGWPINNFFGRRQPELIIRLFIECKHIKNPVVFWFKQKQIKSALELAKDNRIMRGKPDHYFNQMPTPHHYADNVQVAKVAANGGSRDDIFDAMNQCLNGLIFYGNSKDMPSPYCIDFPIIITDSLQNLNRRDNSESGYALILEPFQLEVDYSYKQSKSDGSSADIKKYFLLDIVSFDKLDSFFQDLENRDMKFLKQNLAWNLEEQESKQRNSQLRRNRNDFSSFI